MHSPYEIKKHINSLLSDAIDAATCISEEYPSRYDKVLMSRLKSVQKYLKELT